MWDPPIRGSPFFNLQKSRRRITPAISIQFPAKSTRPVPPLQPYLSPAPSSIFSLSFPCKSCPQAATNPRRSSITAAGNFFNPGRLCQPPTPRLCASLPLVNALLLTPFFLQSGDPSELDSESSTPPRSVLAQPLPEHARDAGIASIVSVGPR